MACGEQQRQDLLPAVAQAGIDRAVITARHHQQPRGILAVAVADLEAVVERGDGDHGGDLFGLGLQGPSLEIVKPFLGHPP